MMRVFQLTTSPLVRNHGCPESKSWYRCVCTTTAPPHHNKRDGSSHIQLQKALYTREVPQLSQNIHRPICPAHNGSKRKRKENHMSACGVPSPFFAFLTFDHIFYLNIIAIFHLCQSPMPTGTSSPMHCSPSAPCSQVPCCDCRRARSSVTKAIYCKHFNFGSRASAIRRFAPSVSHSYF